MHTVDKDYLNSALRFFLNILKFVCRQSVNIQLQSVTKWDMSIHIKSNSNPSNPKCSTKNSLILHYCVHKNDNLFLSIVII